MTRFFISLQAGVAFVLDCMHRMVGGEIFVPKIPSCRTSLLVDIMSTGCKVQVIGRRPGEKMHEVLISEDDSVHAYELEDRFIVTPSHAFWAAPSKHVRGKPCPEGFSYASNTNPDQLSEEQVRDVCRQLARELGIEDGF